ncbi:MAG: class I SAM-dependent methyltransferase [Verrucomicrobiales bacterium]|nr:class I SAM-dependent methyltransferase [Verrucomicrobiales bacterium]
MIVSAASVDVDEVADHYDRLNEFYLEVWGEHRHHAYWETGKESATEAIELMMQRIWRAVDLSTGGRVVDVGCGSGGLARIFAQQCGAEVVGYTVSAEERECAEKSSETLQQGSAVFFCRDWLQNDVPDQWADAVVLIESFSHLKNRGQVLAEVARVLKPGGRLLLADWVAAPDVSQWKVKFLLQPMCRGGRLTGLNSMTENLELIEGGGLKCLEASDITSAVKKTWWVIAYRLMKKVLSEAKYRALLWRSLREDRDTFFAIPRVMLAYQSGCLNYGWILAQKGGCDQVKSEADEGHE